MREAAEGSRESRPLGRYSIFSFSDSIVFAPSGSLLASEHLELIHAHGTNFDPDVFHTGDEVRARQQRAELRSHAGRRALSV